MKIKHQNFMSKILVTTCLFVAGLISLFYVSVAIRPSGPYTPLASTDFFFDKGNLSREIIFNPKFCRNHEIAIVSSKPFLATEQFYWKLKVQVYRFGLKIEEKEIIEETRTFSDNTLKMINQISFGWIRTFDLLPGEAMVRIQVEKGDSNSSKYAESFRVIVRPSPII